MALDNTDPNIALQAGNIPQNFQGGFNNALQMQFRMQQLRQVQQSENALRQLYGNPSNLDQSGRPTQNAMGQLMRDAPEVGLGLQQRLAQIDDRKFHAQVEQSAVLKAQKATAYGVGVASRDAYRKTFEATGNEKLARQKMAEVRDQELKEAVAGGTMTPEQAQGFPAPDPVTYDAHISAYEAQNTKPLTAHEKIQAQQKDRELTEKEKHDRVTESTAAQRAGQAEYGNAFNAMVRNPDGTTAPMMVEADKHGGGYVDANDRSKTVHVLQRVGDQQPASQEAKEIRADLQADYKQPGPSNYEMARGSGAEQLKLIKDRNPGYNAQFYAVAQRRRNSYEGGGQDGKEMKAMNTVVHHLTVFDDVAEALGTHSVPAINKVIQFVNTQMGHPEVTNFNTAKDLIADEVVNAVAGSGAVYDRKGLADKLASDRSGEQFKGQAEILRRLMAGRMGSKYQDWISTPRLPDDEFISKLEPETIEGIRSYAPSNLKKALGGEDAAGKGDKSEAPKFDMSAPAKKGEVPPASAFGPKMNRIKNEHGEIYELRDGKVVKVN